MSELKKVKAADLFNLIDELLTKNLSAWITVTGMSMYPFLREGIDKVELSRFKYEALKKGDIVLIKRETGAYVLHRIIKKEASCFYITGDAQHLVEGPLYPQQLHAVVTRVNRGGRIIKCSNPILSFLASIWIFLLPFRSRIIYYYHKLRRYMRRISSQRLS